MKNQKPIDIATSSGARPEYFLNAILSVLSEEELIRIRRRLETQNRVVVANLVSAELATRKKSSL
jgi:hypothetical protein